MVKKDFQGTEGTFKAALTEIRCVNIFGGSGETYRTVDVGIADMVDSFLIYVIPMMMPVVCRMSRKNKGQPDTAADCGEQNREWGNGCQVQRFLIDDTQKCNRNQDSEEVQIPDIFNDAVYQQYGNQNIGSV